VHQLVNKNNFDDIKTQQHDVRVEKQFILFIFLTIYNSKLICQSTRTVALRVQCSYHTIPTNPTTDSTIKAGINYKEQ
jgi:hypothetical protein